MSILDGPSVPQAPAPAAQAAPADVLAPQAPQAEGFLNELGVNWNDVPTSNNPSDGTHRCFVTKSEIRTKKKDQSKHWVFTYRVADGESEQGRTADEWRAIPVTMNGHFASEKDESAARWLKQRLMSLGVPEDRVGTVRPVDVQGVEVYVTFKTNTTSAGTFQNVTNVKLVSEVPSGPISVQQPGQVQGLI